MKPRDAERLQRWIDDARRRTCELFAAIADDSLLGPRLSIVNPPAWEYGHVAWFQERWALRHAAGRAPLREGVDALYDSSVIPHDVRWDLPLPSRAETLAYLGETARATSDVLRSLALPARYYVELSVLHEDMHDEALAFTRQTLGYPAPSLSDARPVESGGELTGDAAVPGGTYLLGAAADARAGEGDLFVFDNEQWSHPRSVAPFEIARAPVTQAEFARFADERGYARRELWTEAGWAWRLSSGAKAPAYWERRGREWWRRDFDRWVPLEPHRPMVHVSLHEAEAYCRFVGRRLPTELEWEVAASAEPEGRGLSPRKRRYPWGDAPPTPERAHLDFRALHAIDVGALPAGDSAFGCRQMIGNVWEWTASPFLPYPGFSAGPYRDYSQPWFGTHQVIRGGSFATTSRIAHNGFRNFYTPDRRDPWVGFRTCAPVPE
jgi:iron(II)-dependent oxidoreductase